MDSKDLSKEELIGILEVIEGARNCVAPDDLKDVIVKAKDLVSADRAICGVAKVSEGGVREIVSVVNGNYPMEWLSSYLAGKLYFVDPIVRYHAQCSLTQFWSDIFKVSTDRQSRLAIDHAADFGLKYGLSSGIFVPESNNVSILAFAGDRNRYSTHHKKIMDIISLHINNALVKSTYEFQSPAAFPELDHKAFLR